MNRANVIKLRVCKKLGLRLCFVSLLSVIWLSSLAVGYEVELLWEDAYGGTEDERGNDVLIAPDGNIVVVGTTYSFGAGSTDVYLLKTDTNGVQLGDKTFGTAEYEYGTGFRLTSDNGLIIAGWKSHEPWINYAKLLLIKADLDGSEIWTEDFSYNTGVYALSVTEALDGGYVAVGSCHKSNYSKVGLLRTDSAGNKVWLKVYDSPLSYAERAVHVERKPDGGFILCGRESDNRGRGFLLETDPNNDLKWRKIYFNNSHELVFTCVRLTSDGNYIVCGYTHRNYYYDGYIAKIDQQGNMLWSREYDWENKNESFTSIIETGPDEYVICGYIRHPHWAAHKAICLKINFFGNVLWKRILDNAVDASAIVKADNRTFFVTGTTDSLGAGAEDIYLAKIEEPIISTPLLYADPNRLLFVSSIDYNKPIVQTAAIYNQGIGTLNWDIQEDCDWLDVVPNSGSSMGEVDEIEISIDKSGLDAGTYTYDVRVIDHSAANSPYLIKVKLIIHGYTVNVPDEFDTIQQAIDAVSDGGTVIVGPGIHEGEGNYDIDFKGKAITVRGAHPNDPNIVALTVIDGSSVDDRWYHNGFSFDSNEGPNSVLFGLSIRGFRGSGIAISNARPVIRKCRIYGNEEGISADFTLTDKIETLISDCNISHNKGYGLGINNSDVKVSNCVIENNRGSGVEVTGGCGGGRGDLLLENCRISHNNYIGLDFRGSSRDSSVFIYNCSIVANKGSNGGGICSGCNLTLENSIIAGNYSPYTGGAIVFYDPLTIRNCTIVGNVAERGYVLSCNSYVGADIENSIIAGNYPDSTIRFRGNYNNYIDFSNVEGGMNSIQLDEGAILNWGEGNIDADPCFVEAGYWDVNGVWVEADYRLLSGSPCIDAGDPNYLPKPNETDLDGEPRVVDGDEDGVAVVDMGAYEFIPSVEAKMKLTPQTLSCTGKGKFIKAHIILPEEILPEDIDVNSPAIANPPDIDSEYIKLLGGDSGPVKLEIAFDRAAFCEALTETAEIEVTVYGYLTTSREFYATDTIRIRAQSPHRRRLRAH